MGCTAWSYNFECKVTIKRICVTIVIILLLLNFLLYHLYWIVCLLNGHANNCDPESIAMILSRGNEISSASKTNGISEFSQLIKLNNELHVTPILKKPKSHVISHKLYRKYDGILQQYIFQKKKEMDINIKQNNLNIKLAIVIGQRRGGTTMFNARLASHPQIANAGEVLESFFQNNCSYFSYLTHSYSFMKNSKNYCSTKTLYQHLTFKYKLYIDEVFETHKNLNKYKEKMYDNYAITPKVQIEQIPDSLYVGLIEYILMNDIILINMRRSATIASFWSYQADSIERIQVFKKYKNLNQIVVRKRNDTRYKKISNQINIDTNLAKYYVNTIDNKRFEFLNLLYFSSISKNINVSFITVYYEQLIGFYSSIYWQMILQLLNVTQDDKLLSISVKREHPQPCWVKIKNWKQTKQKLKGTKSYFACQSLFS